MKAKGSIFIILLLVSAVLSGCAHPLIIKRPAHIPADELNLEGWDKVAVIKQFGEPLATSESELSESWYYAKPYEIWIWFEDNKVKSWEVR